MLHALEAIMLLLDLADACRKSGLKVVEVDGWQTRGHGQMLGVNTIACHHTATSAKAAGDYPSLGIVRDGRPDLDGPLAQLGLGRSGTVYVIAAGVAYHAGATFYSRQDNWHAIGIEAEADGLSAWPQAQYDAYALLCLTLADHYGIPLANIQGHKEIASPAGRKVDPNFDMTAFRVAVSHARKTAERQAKIEQGAKRRAKWRRWIKRSKKFTDRLKATRG